MFLRGQTLRQQSAVVLPDIEPRTRNSGIHFAVAVRADTAARTIAEPLQASCWATQSRDIEGAIATHPAIEEHPFCHALKPRHRLFKALLANYFDNWTQSREPGVDSPNDQLPRPALACG